MLLSEHYNKPHGEIKITVLEKNKVIQEIEDHNLIVNNASILMAGRMAPGAITGESDEAKEGDYFDFGLKYLALGVGILTDPTQPYDPITNPTDTSQWDFLNPPEPELTDTKLAGEIFRKQFTSWCFLNPDGSTSDIATNILQLSTTIFEDEANGTLSEIALFGANATEEKDSGVIFNRKCYACITKSNNHRINVVWKITF